VLVGGLGTRLRPLTFNVPKPLLAVDDKPILQWIIEGLRAGGCREIIMATGYLADAIERFCGDGSRFAVQISYAREREPLGTAGPLSLVRRRIARDEFFILINGDVITGLDFADFLSFARQHDYDLTVGYVHHTYQSPFGVLTVENNEVVHIVEKPEVRSCISSGIYVLKGAALEYVPEATFFSVPDLIHTLQSHHRPVGAYHIRAFWLAIENLGHIERIRKLLNDQTPGLVHANRHSPSFSRGTGRV
jgi:NDP-sugar pyrophosphorylase family protein